MKKITRLILPIIILTLLSVGFLLTVRASEAVSNVSSLGEDKSGLEQSGPPWLNEDWHYRRPMNISNSGTFLSWYQVLVRLDSVNFDFNLAKADGSDVRFTH